MSKKQEAFLGMTLLVAAQSLLFSLKLFLVASSLRAKLFRKVLERSQLETVRLLGINPTGIKIVEVRNNLK